ncbi:MAG TPA: winged helix-turn-helix transcriptional regulator [Methylomirabilota bacterium]|jgi:predicted transcriptional regulator|nr:winged helix-turn-helix transcriptional regulator [Methylomirabilota bacterium]
MNTAKPTDTAVVEDFWADLNRDILNCLAKGPVSPGEIGRRLGISEGAAASCLSLLASEGRVRICLVEKAPAVA